MPSRRARHEFDGLRRQPPLMAMRASPNSDLPVISPQTSPRGARRRCPSVSGDGVFVASCHATARCHLSRRDATGFAASLWFQELRASILSHFHRRQMPSPCQQLPRPHATREQRLPRPERHRGKRAKRAFHDGLALKRHATPARRLAARLGATTADMLLPRPEENTLCSPPSAAHSKDGPCLRHATLALYFAISPTDFHVPFFRWRYRPKHGFT